MSVGTELDELLGELRSEDKLLLTTHENPDGDALGSLLGMHWVLQQIGKDSLMYMSPDEFPLPYEYRDLTFDGLVGAPPDDIHDRVVVFLDCGNIDRMPVEFLQAELASQLTLKRTPSLEFVYDESIDRGMRITQLLQAESPEDRS